MGDTTVIKRQENIHRLSDKTDSINNTWKNTVNVKTPPTTLFISVHNKEIAISNW